jgi:hypothetical protein
VIPGIAALFLALHEAGTAHAAAEVGQERHRADDGTLQDGAGETAPAAVAACRRVACGVGPHLILVCKRGLHGCESVLAVHAVAQVILHIVLPSALFRAEEIE